LRKKAEYFYFELKKKEKLKKKETSKPLTPQAWHSQTCHLTEFHKTDKKIVFFFFFVENKAEGVITFPTTFVAEKSKRKKERKKSF